MFTSEPKIAAQPGVGEARPNPGASPTSTSHKKRARRFRRAMARAHTPRILIHAAIPQQAERARCQGAWIKAINERIANDQPGEAQ